MGDIIQLNQAEIKGQLMRVHVIHSFRSSLCPVFRPHPRLDQSGIRCMQAV
jgi:hypothetical protein